MRATERLQVSAHSAQMLCRAVFRRAVARVRGARGRNHEARMKSGKVEPERSAEVSLLLALVSGRRCDSSLVYIDWREFERVVSFHLVTVSARVALDRLQTPVPVEVSA